MNTNPTPRKAHHPTSFLTKPADEYRAQCRIHLNNGSGAVSLGMVRVGDELRGGTTAALDPATARAIAADLTARADEIEPPAVAPSAEAERHGTYAAELYANLHGPSIGYGEPRGLDYREDDLEAVATWAARHALGLESYEGAGDAASARGERLTPVLRRFAFSGQDGDAARYDGQVVAIVRPLDPDNPADNLDPEVGPMYRVRADDGHAFDVFADELSPVPTPEQIAERILVSDEHGERGEYRYDTRDGVRDMLALAVRIARGEVSL